MKSLKTKQIIIVLIILVVAAVAVFAYSRKSTSTTTINSFEECAKKYPVAESYPSICTVPGGKSFTQKVN